jgi:hypothetical protein
LIYYGACVGTPQRYRCLLERSLHALYPDAPVVTRRGKDSIHATYNDILDEAAGRADLDALVLVHEDVVIRDRQLEATLRDAFSDPSVAVVGVAGARHPRSLSWHAQDECYGSVEESRLHVKWRDAPADVDVVDGLLIALSPWAVANLRFDTTRFSGFHGYDADICMQARAHGKRVVVRPIDVLHVTKGGLGNRSDFLRTDRVWREKWCDSPHLGAGSRRWDLHGGRRAVADALTPAFVRLARGRVRLLQMSSRRPA